MLNMESSATILNYVIPLVEIPELRCDLLGTSSLAKRPIRLLSPTPLRIYRVLTGCAPEISRHPIKLHYVNNMKTMTEVS